ncbi:Immunoglobulin iota chain [Myotis brandtii]|nr:Immunoglobulin iota chain [Myotis brandtii]
MAWLPLYLLPLVVSTGLCADPVLTQPPSASAAPGASAKLTCTLSQEYSTCTIHWYQQRPGQAPRYIMYLTSSGSQGKGAGIPDRFSGSSSGADRYLTISSIQSEDEAEYICGADYSISGQYGFHSDTHKREVGLKPPSLCLLLTGTRDLLPVPLLGAEMLTISCQNPSPFPLLLPKAPQGEAKGGHDTYILIPPLLWAGAGTDHTRPRRPYP